MKVPAFVEMQALSKVAEAQLKADRPVCFELGWGSVRGLMWAELSVHHRADVHRHLVSLPAVRERDSGPLKTARPLDGPEITPKAQGPLFLAPCCRCLSATRLVSLKDLAAFAIEDTQPGRLMRPSEFCCEDDCG